MKKCNLLSEDYLLLQLKLMVIERLAASIFVITFLCSISYDFIDSWIFLHYRNLLSISAIASLFLSAFALLWIAEFFTLCHIMSSNPHQKIHRLQHPYLNMRYFCVSHYFKCKDFLPKINFAKGLSKVLFVHSKNDESCDEICVQKMNHNLSCRF